MSSESLMQLAVLVLAFIIATTVGYLVGLATGSTALGWAAFLTLLYMKL